MNTTDPFEAQAPQAPAQFDPKLVEATEASSEETRAFVEERQQEESAEEGILSLLPPPAEPPVHVLPESIQRLIREIAALIQTPTAIVFTTFFAFLSMLVQRTRAIVLKDGWTESGNLWICIVGESGIGKTPVSKIFFNEINDYDYKDFLQYKKDLSDYNEELKEYNKRNKKSKKDNKSEELTDLDLNIPPVKPVCRQFTVDDATQEAIAKVLEANKRGILWVVDEISDLIRSFERYQAKGTKDRLLSAYDCGKWRLSRKMEDVDLFIPRACVSIFGGIQPKRIKSIFCKEDADSGFLQRFLFVRAQPQNACVWSEDSLSYESKNLLSDILKYMRDNFTIDDNDKPEKINLSEKAKEIWIENYNYNENKGWENYISKEESLSLTKKNHSHTARLALLLHCLEEALSKQPCRLVSEDTMLAAIECSKYFKENNRQLFDFFNDKARPINHIERAILEACIYFSNTVPENEIKIKNSDFFKFVKNRLSSKVSGIIITKNANSLNIETKPIKNCRYKCFHRKQVSAFEQLLRGGK